MSALPLSETEESRNDAVTGQLPYAPLPMPRQRLEAESWLLRDIFGRMMRLPLFATRRGY
ncbi:hypothetical protein [Pelagibacterium xiamenense]|uniref:hypothetical protein n=1 Tax=Pelagibacterium xiamenense TaxID=2901140 RepID=UPI001E551BC3|nr:hypothetical protein [Pelagibacterium xiamenense]MCD7059148.1 hypothetical protein [Pelagibacterium xiamenense]